MLHVFALLSTASHRKPVSGIGAIEDAVAGTVCCEQRNARELK